jgi:hypothetical protein
MSNLAHDLAIAIVAGLLVFHHGLTVRSDAVVGSTATKEEEKVEATWRVRAADAGRLQTARNDLQRRGVEVEVVSEPAPERT